MRYKELFCDEYTYSTLSSISLSFAFIFPTWYPSPSVSLKRTVMSLFSKIGSSSFQFIKFMYSIAYPTCDVLYSSVATTWRTEGDHLYPKTSRRLVNPPKEHTYLYFMLTYLLPVICGLKLMLASAYEAKSALVIGSILQPY